MLLIRRRADREIPGRRQRDIALGLQLAGNNVEVAPGLYAQITACGYRRAKLGDVAAVVFAIEVQAVGYLGGRDVHVAARAEREVPAGLQHAAKVADVTPGRHAQVVGGLDAGSAVGVVLVQLAARGTVERNVAAFVDHIPTYRRGADIPAYLWLPRALARGTRLYRLIHTEAALPATHC